MLGENALFADIGKVFHPLFLLFGWILAGIYSVIPNYGVAIAGLTILIMLALTPVTVKSTKSMLAMQRLQPEMKKLQAKFKGPENREALNSEMMKLYKENGTSPFGACLPSFLQMPFLIVLYSLIRGLSFVATKGQQYTNAAGKTVTCHLKACIAPRYIPGNSRIHQNLIASKGQMHFWFGMNLSSTPFAHHGTDQFLLVLPYLALIGFAIFFQYYQMKQMNSRNPGAAQANPQMQQMQKFFPIIFGLIYLRVPAGATIYMVVSSAMRIGTQEIMFRSGMVTPVAVEREIGPSKPDQTKAALTKAKPVESAPKKPKTTVTDGTGTVSKGTAPPKKPASNGSARPTKRSPQQTNGRASNGTGEDSTGAPAPKAHPRSRAKRERKAR